MTPSPDTGAGTPLTAEEEADLRDWVADVEPKDALARLFATLDAARSRPATDPAGLDVGSIIAEALAHRGEYPVHDRIEPERYRLAADIRRALNDAGYTVVRYAVGGPMRSAPPGLIVGESGPEARLSVADGPGPERLVRVARALLAAAQPDDDAEGQYVEFLVPFEAIEELRAALPVEETGRS